MLAMQAQMLQTM
jgi:hypothetical protein